MEAILDTHNMCLLFTHTWMVWQAGMSGTGDDQTKQHNKTPTNWLVSSPCILTQYVTFDLSEWYQSKSKLEQRAGGRGRRGS